MNLLTTIAIFLYEMISALIRVALLGTGHEDLRETL